MFNGMFIEERYEVVLKIEAKAKRWSNVLTLLSFIIAAVAIVSMLLKTDISNLYAGEVIGMLIVVAINALGMRLLGVCLVWTYYWLVLKMKVEENSALSMMFFAHFIGFIMYLKYRNYRKVLEEKLGII